MNEIIGKREFGFVCFPCVFMLLGGTCTYHADEIRYSKRVDCLGDTVYEIEFFVKGEYQGCVDADFVRKVSYCNLDLDVKIVFEKGVLYGEA